MAPVLKGTRHHAQVVEIGMKFFLGEKIVIDVGHKSICEHSEVLFDQPN
jgi:hypothetical protein